MRRGRGNLATSVTFEVLAKRASVAIGLGGMLAVDGSDIPKSRTL
jgi:hypothetical protein